MIILSVCLFAAGVALMMMSANFHALHRSKVPRQFQGSAGAKSIWSVVLGGTLMAAGIVLLVVRAVAAP